MAEPDDWKDDPPDWLPPVGSLVKMGFYKRGGRTDKHTETCLVLDRQPVIVEENKGSSSLPRMVEVRNWRVLLSPIGSLPRFRMPLLRWSSSGFFHRPPNAVLALGASDDEREWFLPHNPDEDGWGYLERSFVIHPPDGEPYDLPPEGSEP